MAARPTYLRAAEIGARMLPGGAFILGVIGFGAARPTGYAGPFALVTVDVLGDSPCYEAWASPHPAVWHEEDGASFAVAGDTLFAIMHAEGSAGRSLHDTAYDIYSRMFALADRTGHPHLIRAYNYLADITGDEDGMERYRRFNAGRHEAFAASLRAVDAAPAACALGMRHGPPVVAFLASTAPGQPIENPRQVSAYHYPASHGPRSPSFSRAMLTGTRGARHLHISGTASIVGHESLHPGDAAAQTQEILRNIDALLGRCGAPPAAQARLLLKVYIRHQEDAPAIRRVLAALPAVSQSMFVQAEICRQDLLVEIEAFCPLP